MVCTAPNGRIIVNDEVKRTRKATRILITGLWFEILAQDVQDTQQKWCSVHESLHNSAIHNFHVDTESFRRYNVLETS